MNKYKYITDYEINASPQMVYQYLISPRELESWLANKVELKEKDLYHFYWNGECRPAHIVTQRLNKNVRFQFINENSDDDSKDLAYLDLKLKVSELTQATFLRIIDYSEMDDDEDLKNLWDGLINTLREQLGAR